MGTGIVSISLASAGAHVLSLALLAIAAAGWVGLALVLGVRILHNWPRVRADAANPAALTAVAATAVLGARAVGLGSPAAAAALLALAAGTWLALLGPVLRNWTVPVLGAGFMTTVSTQSLAVVAAELAADQRVRWLLYAALALAVLGLVLYVFTLAGFQYRQLAVGAGDHWVAGGALAISTLAAARIAIAAHVLGLLGGRHTALDTVTLALWAIAAAWLPALILTEVLRPRLRYDVRRWATVFPVGMYAACSFDAGLAAGVPGLVDFAEVWTWVGLTVWTVVFAGMLWSAMMAVGPARRAGGHASTRDGSGSPQA